MKHKLTGSILLALGLAVNSQAVLIDDFDGLAIGGINQNSSSTQIRPVAGLALLI